MERPSLLVLVPPSSLTQVGREDSRKATGGESCRSPLPSLFPFPPLFALRQGPMARACGPSSQVPRWPARALEHSSRGR